MPTRQACWYSAAIPRRWPSSAACFPARDTEKTYWAVVHGAPPAEHGVFDQKLLKVNTRAGWSVKVSDKGQTAITDYKVLGRGPGISWLELKPQTGPHPSDPRTLRRSRLPGDRRPALWTGRAGQAPAPAFARDRAAVVQDQAADQRYRPASATHDRGVESVRI